jgi:hypothetical protein
MEYKQFMQRLVGLGLGPGPIQQWSWITQKQTHNWDCSSMKKNMVATISQLMEITIMVMTQLHREHSAA